MNPTELVADYTRAKDALMAYKDATFPVGKRVRSDVFEGRGIVVEDHACPPNKLPIRVKSGAIWYYKIEDCKPIQ